MPAAQAPRQPDRPAEAWLRREGSLDLLREIQRQAIPELTRVFGHSGLYLRPCAALPETLSGNMLAQVLSLHRDGGRLAGALECEDAALPVASGSLSLAYAVCVLETSPRPESLVGELARVLKPGGVALLLTLNPWGLARLRWSFRGLEPVDPALLSQWLAGRGLEIERQRWLGPMWSPPRATDLQETRPGGLLSGLRAGHLVVARRREAGLTPLRAGKPAMALQPGMSTG